MKYTIVIPDARQVQYDEVYLRRVRRYARKVIYESFVDNIYFQLTVKTDDTTFATLCTALAKGDLQNLPELPGEKEEPNA